MPAGYRPAEAAPLRELFRISAQILDFGGKLGPPERSAGEGNPEDIRVGIVKVEDLVGMSGGGAGGKSHIEIYLADGVPVAGQRHLMGNVVIGEGSNTLFQAFLFPSAAFSELDIACLRKSLPCHCFELL